MFLIDLGIISEMPLDNNMLSGHWRHWRRIEGVEVRIGGVKTPAAVHTHASVSVNKHLKQ